MYRNALPASAAVALALLAGPLPARAQRAGGTPPPAAAPVAEAARRVGEVHLDGLLDEAAWQRAAPVTGLRQYDPDEGAAASLPTELRILYDDQALYIGARMRQPGGVVAPLARRDQLLDASGNNGSFNSLTTDKLIVQLDPYHNRLDEVWFEVNPAGVRGDQFDGDPSWDPIWEAAAHVDSLGWTAEMRIPFSQLRFSRDSAQTWGMQVWRYVDRLNEHDMWAFWGRNAPGRAGLLRGARRAHRHPPPAPARAAALRGHRQHLRQPRRRRPVPRRPRHAPQRRRRPQVPAHQQPHPRRHLQPRLRPGGGRPGLAQPERLRDLLRREAPLLRRRRERLLLRRHALHVLQQQPPA